MSGVTRRTLLAGVAAAGAATTLAAGPARAGAPGLAIYDSRLPEGRAFAAAARAQGVALHDIAHEDGRLWRVSRQLAGAAEHRVIGLTGWTDWVSIRGLLAAQGFRVAHEKPLRPVRAGLATPFEWEMA